MKKKILLTILCGVCLLGITGCGNNNNNNTNSVQNDNSNIDSNNQESKVKSESKKLGDTISLDFVEVSLDSLEVKENYKFKYTEQTSVGKYIKNDSIEPKTSDFKLVTLRGNFTNKTSKDIYTANRPMYGVFKINGNEYKATINAFNTAEAERFSTIQAQQKVEYFFYAEVPTNVANEISSCEIKFGFKKDLDPKVLDFNDLDYIYELKEIPTK